MFEKNNNYTSFSKNWKEVASPCPRHPTVWAEEGMCLFCSYFPVFLFNPPVYYQKSRQCDHPYYRDNPNLRKLLEALVHHLQLPKMELPEICAKTKFPFCEQCFSWVEEVGKIPLQNLDEHQEKQVETIRNNIYEVVTERSNLELRCDQWKGLYEMEMRYQVFTTLRDRINQTVRDIQEVPPDPFSSTPITNNAYDNDTKSFNSKPPVVWVNNHESESATTPSSSSSSQPSGSGSTPPPVNLKLMCLLCPNAVGGWDNEIVLEPEPPVEALERRKLLESVCQHFHLNIVLPKVSWSLVGSRFPICERCHIWIQELGSIPSTDLDKAFQKKVETLKTNIYTQVEIRNRFRKYIETDAIGIQVLQKETTQRVFTRLAEAILEAHTAKLSEMKKLKDDKTRRYVKAEESIKNDFHFRGQRSTSKSRVAQNEGTRHKRICLETSTRKGPPRSCRSRCRKVSNGRDDNTTPATDSTPSPLTLRGMCLFCPKTVSPASEMTGTEPQRVIRKRKQLLETLCHHFNVTDFIEFPKTCERSRFPTCGRCWILIKELGNIPYYRRLNEELQSKVETLKTTIYDKLTSRFKSRTSFVDIMKTQWEPVERNLDVFTELTDVILRANADQDQLMVFDEMYEKYIEEAQRLFPTIRRKEIEVADSYRVENEL